MPAVVRKCRVVNGLSEGQSEMVAVVLAIQLLNDQPKSHENCQQNAHSLVDSQPDNRLAAAVLERQRVVEPSTHSRWCAY